MTSAADGQVPGIWDVMPSAAALLGVASPDPLALRDTLGEVRRVVVVLVDGMGLDLLPLMAPHAPFLASVLAATQGVASVRELRTTFPSTTPTALVSLGTGDRPGRHGVLGFTVAVPGTATALTHVVWRHDPDPRAWQPLPTWFERVADAGRTAQVVLPREFGGSGLTDAAYRGARFVPVAPDDTLAGSMLRVAGDADLTFGYLPDLDTAGHLHGIASRQWQAAAGRVDALLRGLADGLPAGTALLVTADHGMLDVRAPDRPDADRDPVLREGVDLIAGEPRVRYLHVREGAAVDVAAAWSARLGDAVDVFTRDQAIATGWFGPVPPSHAGRIGDLVVVARDDTVVLATGHEPPEVATLVGFHGARSHAETAIPLLSLTI